MIEELNALAKQGILIAEYPNGETASVEKIYEIKGRGGRINILIGDCSISHLNNELEDLKRDYKILEDEEKDAQREIAQLETELLDMGEKHEKELNQIESTIEDLELQLKIQTSARSIKDRIQELAEKLLNK